MPSPLRSWWKLVSSDSNAELAPDTTLTNVAGVVAVAVGVPDRILIGAGNLPGNLVPARHLPPRRSAPRHQTHPQQRPPLKISARDPRHCCYKGQKYLQHELRLVEPSVSIAVVTNPICRRHSSLAGNWSRAISMRSSFPTQCQYARDVVAVAVGVPDRILIGARDLPGNLVSACRLLRADRRPGTKLSRHNVRTTIFQRGT